MRRFSPDELVTLPVGRVKLRAAKIWLICARPPTRAAQKVAARNRRSGARSRGPSVTRC